MKKSRQLLSLFKITAKLSPSYIVLLIVNGLVSALTTLFNVIFPKLLIDCLTTTKDTKQILIYAALVIANNILFKLFQNFFKKEDEIKSSKLQRTFKKYLSQKITKLEYSYLENPYYLDLKDRALFALNNQNAIISLITYSTQFFTQITTIISLIVLLAGLGPVLLIAIAVSVALQVLIYKLIAKDTVWVQTNLIPTNRKFQYYYDACVSKQNQKDIRLYKMQDLLLSKIYEFLQDILKPFAKFYNKLGRHLGFSEVINCLLSAFSYAYIGIRTATEKFGPKISIGSLTMYVTSTITLAQLLNEMGGSLTNMRMEMEFLEPYIEFINLADQDAPCAKEVFTGEIEQVEFEDVSFTYPKADKAVLKNISFKIQRGQKISIVGLNGAGKSTLIKLICRMYKPTSGVIKVNGKNIEEWEYNSYMNAISAVFQDYKIFNFTIAENISCKPDSQDVDTINRLIDEVGLRAAVDSLPEGIQSRFGKEYDEKGIELSGGQSQKIAIARSLYKKSSLVILDEPASALDPMAEAEIYEKFNSLVEDKTAIYISHRMSSSVFCDKILIIDGGTVSDFDTHENLMKKTDSLYYKLFMSQAQNYKLDEA